MYRPASSLEAPPAGSKHIRVSRYIPGARFPDSWDIQTEERTYDSQGRLVNWKRFDAYNGQRIFEKKIVWSAQGEREEERTWRMETNKEEVLKFANQYNAEGKLTSAIISDAQGKAIGQLSIQPNGNRVLQLGASQGARIIVTHDAQGRLISNLDEIQKTEDRYRYDDKGEVSEIERIRNGQSTVTRFKTTYDAQGRISVQEEQVAQGVRKMFFEYDEKGRLLARKWDPVKPSESYHWGLKGELTDILLYGLDGYAKEVFAYFTEFYPN